MGTMNGMQRPSLSDEAVARLVDPRTGQRLRPLGTVNGRVIYPMMGASPDDPSTGGSTDEGGKDPEGTGSESGNSDEGGEPKKDDQSDKGNPDAKIEDLEQEKERHFRRRKEAEKERDDLQAELKKLRDGEKPELEQLQSELETVKTQAQALEESLRDSRLENAFLKDNTFAWHSPGRALHLADLSEVEIDGDGKVHGLKSALEKLAKSDPYLIKQESEKSDEKKARPPKTDDPKNPSKKEKTVDEKKAEAEKLARKYPALRR